MEHPFTWVSIIPGLNQIPGHTATALLVIAAMVAAVILARRQMSRTMDPVIPDEGITLRNIAELAVESIVGMAEGILGHNGRRFAHFYGTFFLFILCANLTGLIPGFAPPTSNLNVTLALGVISFIAYNAIALKEQGVAYLKHFLGPMLLLAPLMLPLELIGNIFRPVSLSLRLLGNMTGDHLVLEIFTGLTKVVIPVVFYLLGTLVCVLQAFVFTLLSMVYLSIALTAHEHEEQSH